MGPLLGSVWPRATGDSTIEFLVQGISDVCSEKRKDGSWTLAVKEREPEGQTPSIPYLVPAEWYFVFGGAFSTYFVPQTLTHVRIFTSLPEIRSGRRTLSGLASMPLKQLLPVHAMSPESSF